MRLIDQHKFKLNRVTTFNMLDNRDLVKNAKVVLIRYIQWGIINSIQREIKR